MISKKFCPRCNSEDIEMIAGGVTGTFICKDCGFSGSVFPEKEIVGREVGGKRAKKEIKVRRRK